MSRQTLICLSACVVLAFTLIYSQTKTVQGQQASSHKVTKATNDEDEIFKDQLVMLEFRSSGDAGDSVVLSRAHVAKLGQREFVVGDGYAPKGEEDVWYAGMVVGIPTEDIVRFDSMDTQRFAEYLKYVKDRSNK